MGTDYGADHRLDHLVYTVGWSPSHLHDRFRHHLQMSPFAYQFRRRLTIAHQQLSTTNDSVAAIAHHVGFRDVSAFIRAFRRTMGTIPAQWRRR